MVTDRSLLPATHTGRLRDVVFYEVRAELGMKCPNWQYMDLETLPFVPLAERVQRLPQHEWQALKNEVHEASGHVCAYCAVDAIRRPICDHKIPLARGGTNDRTNLVTACARCNSEKGQLTPEEFARKRSFMRAA